MTPEIKNTVLVALSTFAGDDLYLAEAAWKNLPPAKMQELYGESRKTRQQIVDGYRAHTQRVREAVEWVKKQ